MRPACSPKPHQAVITALLEHRGNSAPRPPTSRPTGSDDGTACVWDLRSRQPVQIIQHPGKQPVTAALVVACPEGLALGGAAGGGGALQGFKRALPLAPLVK